ncbi:hypothetical protein GCM10010872_37820 [Dyella flava]|nr:hypothetical protein GCM10010872_37820 [Dyella flava]
MDSPDGASRLSSWFLGPDYRMDVQAHPIIGPTLERRTGFSGIDTTPRIFQPLGRKAWRRISRLKADRD